MEFEIEVSSMAVVEPESWGERRRVRAATYVDGPRASVTSVRAMVLQLDIVLVRQDGSDLQLLPNEGPNPNETPELTLRRWTEEAG